MTATGRGAELPAAVSPMLATSGPVPTAPGWAVEFKWDGVRAIVAAAAGRVRLTSRNGNDISGGYPEVVAACAGIEQPVLLDGELVVLDRSGRPDFGLLQQRMHLRTPAPELCARLPVSLYVFDVLQVGGQRLLAEPFDARRERLVGLELGGRSGVAVPPSYTDVDGRQLLEVARGHRLEGVVAKRRTSRYEPGKRSGAWVKTPLSTTREVLVGGWTAGAGRRAGTLGALLLGARDATGRLRYLGNVGTGFTEPVLRDLLARLDGLRRDSSPFDEPLPRTALRGVQWARPELVGEVEYRTLTAEHRLRHAAWRGLRPDRDPEEVLIELA